MIDSRRLKVNFLLKLKMSKAVPTPILITRILDSSGIPESFLRIWYSSGNSLISQRTRGICKVLFNKRQDALQSQLFVVKLVLGPKCTVFKHMQHSHQLIDICTAHYAYWFDETVIGIITRRFYFTPEWLKRLWNISN